MPPCRRWRSCARRWRLGLGFGFVSPQRLVGRTKGTLPIGNLTGGLRKRLVVGREQSNWREGGREGGREEGREGGRDGTQMRRPSKWKHALSLRSWLSCDFGWSMTFPHQQKVIIFQGADPWPRMTLSSLSVSRSRAIFSWSLNGSLLYTRFLQKTVPFAIFRGVPCKGGNANPPRENVGNARGCALE